MLRTGEAFQTFGQIRRIAFDKTGTLTEGVSTVRELEARGDDEELLALAAAAEAPSEHPLGAAIVVAARERGLKVAAGMEFESFSGQGVRALVNGAAVLVGRPSFISERAGRLGPLGDRVAELEEAGRTVVAGRQGRPVSGSDRPG